MDYFDEILNVYAYLKQKEKGTAESTRIIIGELAKLQTVSCELEHQFDRYLAEAKELTRKLGSMYKTVYRTQRTMIW